MDLGRRHRVAGPMMIGDEGVASNDAEPSRCCCADLTRVFDLPRPLCCRLLTRSSGSNQLGSSKGAFSGADCHSSWQAQGGCDCEKAALIGTALVALAPAALAADLGSFVRDRLHAKVYEPAFTWTGFTSVPRWATAGAREFSDSCGGGFDQDGWFGGGFIGFNWQKDRFVFRDRGDARGHRALRIFHMTSIAQDRRTVFDPRACRVCARLAHLRNRGMG